MYYNKRLILKYYSYYRTNIIEFQHGYLRIQLDSNTIYIKADLS